MPYAYGNLIPSVLNGFVEIDDMKLAEGEVGELQDKSVIKIGDREFEFNQGTQRTPTRKRREMKVSWNIRNKMILQAFRRRRLRYLRWDSPKSSILRR